jgi:carboxypeptidase C (cathepsin A)
LTSRGCFPPDAVSQHTLVLGDKRLAYTATAGTLPLTGPKGEITARIFSVAYTQDEKVSDRPSPSCSMAGPGQHPLTSIWGLWAARRHFTANGATAVQPVALADNPDAWLDFTDLVFVDPVATGYSRSAAGTDEADKAFFGVEKDADAMADFVRLMLTRTGRTLAPVFLAGESYGGFRVALVAQRLVSAGISVRGVVMISPALEFSMLRGNPYVPLPTALALPSIAATHLERRDGPDGSLATLPDVERFARSAYLVHLAAGMKNDADIDRTLANYTGLAPDLIRDHMSRVSVRTFTREYEKRGDRVLSRYDGTVTAPVPRRSDIRFDPILDGATTVLTPAFAQYARGELGYRTDLEYRLLNRRSAAAGTSAPARTGRASRARWRSCSRRARTAPASACSLRTATPIS